MRLCGFCVEAAGSWACSDLLPVSFSSRTDASDIKRRRRSGGLETALSFGCIFDSRTEILNAAKREIKACVKNILGPYHLFWKKTLNNLGKIKADFLCEV